MFQLASVDYSPIRDFTIHAGIFRAASLEIRAISNRINVVAATISRERRRTPLSLSLVSNVCVSPARCSSTIV